MKKVAHTINKDLIIWILKFLFKLSFGLNIRKYIQIAKKWKKNLPHTTCVTGITPPKYFAVESIHTNKKKPEADRKITLIKEAFWFSDMINYFKLTKKITLQRLLAKDWTPRHRSH